MHAAAAASASAADAGMSGERTTYHQILKSSAWIGGSTLVNLAIGLLRTKAMALLLGPAGFGLLALYSSVFDLVRSLVQMGVNSSGVRQIAEAHASHDAGRVATTVTVLRRMTLVLAGLGAALLVVLAPWLSELTFGNANHAGAIAGLSLALVFRLVADSQAALLQGLRRIADLAKLGVAGAVLGTLLGLPLIWWLGQDGVVPSLVAVSAASLACSWWYSRRLGLRPAAVSPAQRRHEASALLKLGVVFMASGFLMMGASYAARLILMREAGLESAGLYHAAWTLGGLYTGFVLQAMSTDFYPRLVGAAKDNPLSNRLANEQAHVSLLLAGPGVIGTLTLAPLVLTTFYSGDFVHAVDTLRWICLGMALRVITWPMGYIVVAQGAQRMFFGIELAWTLLNVGLTALWVERFGLVGAGVAFFASYVAHGLIVYPLVRRLTGFRWSAPNVRAIFMFLLSVGGVFAATQWLPWQAALAVGLAMLVASSLHSLRTLAGLVDDVRLPRQVLRVLAWLRFERAGSPS